MLTPHWHAQVEVNFIVRGAIHYQMHEHDVRSRPATCACSGAGCRIRWIDTAEDTLLRRASTCRWSISSACICRATIQQPADARRDAGDRGTDAEDDAAISSAGTATCARATRGQGRARGQRAAAAARADALRALPAGGGRERRSASARRPLDQQLPAMSGACATSSPRISATTSTAIDIAPSADIHPKYAMSIFKKSTGMTLNEYVNLLRLSYAQALLMQRGRQRAARRHGLAASARSALQQIVPQARRHVASDFKREHRQRPPAAEARG